MITHFTTFVFTKCIKDNKAQSGLYFSKDEVEHIRLQVRARRALAKISKQHALPHIENIRDADQLFQTFHKRND